MKRILWCMTGAGHMLKEIADSMEELSKSAEITVALSNLAYPVVKMYSLAKRIEAVSGKRVILEKDQRGSYPVMGDIFSKRFHGIVVSPCSANTIAKIAHGIADTLVTNIVAQGAKNRIPVMVFPTDSVPGKTETTLPNGEKAVLYVRKIDADNSEKLSGMEGIRVMKNPGEAMKILYIKK